jgi:hypothetical protein
MRWLSSDSAPRRNAHAERGREIERERERERVRERVRDRERERDGDACRHACMPIDVHQHLAPQARTSHREVAWFLDKFNI